jgi:hypothetical protein
VRIGILDRAHGGWIPSEIGQKALSPEAEAIGSLAMALAEAGHEVAVFHRTDRPTVQGRLRTVRSVGLAVDALAGNDALIAVHPWDPAAVAAWRRVVRPVVA